MHSKHAKKYKQTTADISTHFGHFITQTRTIQLNKFRQNNYKILHLFRYYLLCLISVSFTPNDSTILEVYIKFGVYLLYCEYT